MNTIDTPMQWDPLEPVERAEDAFPHVSLPIHRSVLAWRSRANTAGLLALTMQTVALAALTLVLMMR